MGDKNLLRLRPNKRIIDWGPLVDVQNVGDNQVLCYYIKDNGDDPQIIENKYKTMSLT